MVLLCFQTLFFEVIFQFFTPFFFSFFLALYYYQNWGHRLRVKVCSNHPRSTPSFIFHLTNSRYQYPFLLTLISYFEPIFFLVFILDSFPSLISAIISSKYLINIRNTGYVARESVLSIPVCMQIKYVLMFHTLYTYIYCRLIFSISLDWIELAACRMYVDFNRKLNLAGFHSHISFQLILYSVTSSSHLRCWPCWLHFVRRKYRPSYSTHLTSFITLSRFSFSALKKNICNLLYQVYLFLVFCHFWVMKHRNCSDFLFYFIIF